MTHDSPTVRLIGYDPEDERRRESLFSLGNGVLLLRSSMPWSEADGTHYPGLYFAGCYNPLQSTIDGEIEWNASLVNLPNGLRLEFRIEDADWFSLDAVELLHYEQRLDIPNAIMCRSMRFRDGAGRIATLEEERFVSMDAPNLVGQRLRLIPHNWSGTVLLKSQIDGSVINDNLEKHADYAHKHLDVLGKGTAGSGLFLEARTINSNLHIAVRTRDLTSTPPVDVQTSETEERRVSHSFVLKAAPNEPIILDRLMAVCVGEGVEVAEEASNVLTAADAYEPAQQRHRLAWQKLWERMPFAAADKAMEQAQHLTLFHLLQNYSPHSIGRDVSLPARGWQEVYRGQIFWDEMFSVPVLSIRYPELARELLLYRHARLDAARDNARKYGLDGALYPWRSARTGAEETPRFQKSNINGHWRKDHTEHQAHINASIAWDIFHYAWASGDEAFLYDQGLTMLIEICRMWASLAVSSPEDDRFDIRGVVGPDEFHTGYADRSEPGIDNNAHTNVMAAWTLGEVLRLLEKASEKRDGTPQVSDDEKRHWDHISRRLRLCFTPDHLLAQFEGVERLLELDPDSLGKGSADWELEARGEDINHYQIFKQADSAMLLYLLPIEDLQALLLHLGYEVSAEQLHRSVEYYRSRTSHGSSLSQVSYAAALSHFDLETSYNLWRKALAPDLDPKNSQSTAEGLHLGSMAAALDVLQRHYLGLTVRADGLAIDPHLPDELSALEFSFHYQGGRYKLKWNGSKLRLSSDGTDADNLTVFVRGEAQQLRAGQSLIISKL
ncbi:Trehalose and maltose hydrolase (possible phosphorylase) [Devosia crocina]|uniref:Trehalose and maltose hydrolase (Possible phosphorylase) n=1 Tax=Devosia crocina TaxID=429728 RepID=A0A1I7MWZ7_9HYPH|nr:glycosyl hydrolase family 65 protein [Devosia crocina]SFV26856.1 Trehalose and maltose hydrolase (possible phosphorylase) [Devosia crocina]